MCLKNKTKQLMITFANLFLPPYFGKWHGDMQLDTDV